MDPNEVTAHIVDTAYNIHKALGPGLPEAVYEVTLAHELRKRGRIVNGLPEAFKSTHEGQQDNSRRDAEKTGNTRAF